MKKIEAIIRHSRLSDVKDAVNALGAQGMTVTEVRGFGRQKGNPGVYRGVEYNADFIPKIKVEVVTSDHDAEDMVNAIMGASRTGELGDGKIFVTNLSAAIRIRTGEDDKALAGGVLVGQGAE